MQKMTDGKPVVIGVFINQKHARDLITMNPEFVSSHRYVRYIELAKANQDEKVILYFFAPVNVSFEKKTVMGIYYNSAENNWQEKPFPLPHLLYDRGGGIGQRSKLVIHKFRELGIKNINSRHFFDKWDLYFRLSKLKSMSPHLPVTVQGGNPLNVLEVLNQYGQVYVKTRRGSCGMGVIRIEKLGSNIFRYYYSYGGKLFSQILSGLDLMKMIRRLFANKPYIIQKQIDLMKMGHGIIDFRSEVQKNENGSLVITGTTARIGRPHSPIASNTRTEDYYTLEEFAVSVMQLDKKKAAILQARINAFLKAVFQAVEHVYGPFGELGIDFGLDTRGHLWLIECNSKSARVALYHGFGRRTVRQSFRNLLNYAKYLMEAKNTEKRR